MKHKIIVISFILLASVCQARTIKEPQRTVIRPQPSFSRQALALVIGNLRYEHNPLNNPVNDATDMGRLLKEIGFEVTLKTNLNQRAMEDAIREFAQRLSENRGIGLFYFAGHGAQVKGRNYLLPIDNSRIQDEIDLEKTAYYVDEILKRMENATLNIIILDACRDNPYRGGRTLKRGLAPMLSTTLGSIIAFATSPGKTAADRDKKGRNGLFTSHLLSALKKAYQTHQRLDDMFMAVHKAVAQESRGRQKPWYSDSLTEPFCFGGCQTVPPPPPPKNLVPEMVWLPAGRFKMGNMNVTSFQGGGESDEQPVHEVSVNRFAISRYEITFAEYDHFAQATGRDKPDDEGWGRGNRPVINISWHDAQAYTEWLSQETGQQYRLPTEAEWEYAARAGTQTRYWWGNEIGANRANCDGCGSRWDKTAPVGSFAPNAFGLYDTSGNVEEWTCSQYEDKYRGNEQACVKSANEIVLRGGSGIDFISRLRSAFRNSRKPSERFIFVGFRVVRE